MTSVVIAAHNEAAVIEACVTSVLAPGQNATDVIVVANGCSDDTVDRAAAAGARVVDLPEPGKAAALNTGDGAVTGFPRAYLDADIAIPRGALATLAAALAQPGVLAVVPARRLDLAGRPFAVRAYYTINARLPAFADGLFGRGLIMLSADGRGRFAEFPEALADDLFLDSLFTRAEKRMVGEVVVTVATPMTTAALLRRLVRVRRGNSALRRLARTDHTHATVRPARRSSWLRDVVARDPRMVPHAIVYVVLTIIAATIARLRPTSTGWGQDTTSRANRP